MIGLAALQWTAGSARFSRWTQTPPRASNNPSSKLTAGPILAVLFLQMANCSIAELPFAVTPSPPARVVTVSDPAATDAFVARPEVVRAMVDRAITYFTHQSSVRSAWLSLVSTQDVVGIKVYSLSGQYSGTRPAVVAGVIQGLLKAGLPPKQIVIWDKQSTDLRQAGYFDLGERFGVRVEPSSQDGYDLTNFYESSIIGNLVWGDVQFGQKEAGVGRRSYVSKLVSREVTKIINIPPLLNHNMAGVSGNLYSLASGSVDNFTRFELDANRLAVAVPEIYALPTLSDRVVLNIVDALICQYEGEERGRLHNSTTLNELRFSKDPVALDVLSLKELDRQRATARAPEAKPDRDLYGNAALLELGINDLKRIQVEHVP
jgi:hypothetical protein